MEIVNPQGSFQAMQRVATASGLKIQIDRDCDQPCTDMVKGTVYMPPLYTTSTPSEAKRWRAYGYHECGHHSQNCSDYLQMMMDRKLASNTILGRICNILEDIRNERTDIGKYVGRDDDLGFTQAWHCADGAKMMKAQGVPADPDMRLFTEALGLAYRYRSATFQPQVMQASAIYDSVVDSSHLDQFQPDIDSMRTADEVYELALKIIDQDPEHSAVEAQQESEEEYDKQQAGKGDGEDGEGDPSQADKSDGQTDEDGEGAEPVAGGEISYRDLLAHDHDDSVPGHAGMLKIIYDHDPADDYVAHEVNTVRELEPTTKVGRKIQEAYDEGSRLGNEVIRLFQAKSQRRKTNRHESGKLVGRDLHRLLNRDFDVFQRNRPMDDMKSVAISLLVDCSGSMGGPRFAAASAAAALMSEPLAVVGIKHEIIGFTENGRNLMTFPIKTFGEIKNADTILRTLTRVEKDDLMYSNADGESLLWAGERLINQRANRRIMIVLSDGQPSSHQPGDAFTHTQNVVKVLSKHIECYGIGILSSAVEGIYPESTVLHNTEELQQCLLNVIRTKVLGE